jgi:four helix bundle protein
MESRPHNNFKTFEDLEAYQAARNFRKAMYRIARTLPDIEKFGLVSQVRRAAVSLTNNIAEGDGRYHYPDQIKFMMQARGSLEELIDDLNVCSDENYIAQTEVDRLKQQGGSVEQLLNGYIRYLRQRHNNGSMVLRDGDGAANMECLTEPDDAF